jgi:hypothetical protein
VECDEVYIVAGHQGKPEAVVNKGASAGVDGFKANADAAHLNAKSRQLLG